MSYGASPYDDDPALRQQPPIVPPEAEGPAAPDAIDPMMANLPPAPPPGTIQDPDAWPPPVPPEAPGMVPPQQIPPAPGPANPSQASPGQGAGLSPSGSPIDLHRAAEEMGRANETADKARREYQQAQVDEEQAKAPEVHAAAEAAQQRVDHMQAAQDQENAIRQRYDALETTAQGEHQRTLDAFRKFKFKDFWADKPMATRAASALAVALGGFGAGLTKTPNYALQILDKQMDDDHNLQVANLHQLSDEEVMARTKIGDIQTARSKALADVTAADAQKDRLIAAQLEAAAARSQDANYQQHVGTFAKKLQVEAAEKDVLARKMYFDAADKAEQAEALAAQRRAAAHLSDVRAAAGGFAPHRGRAAMGGHGGGGRGDALSAFTAAALDGKTSEADLAGMGLRAGLKPNQVSAEVARIRKEHAGGASGGNGLGQDRLLSKEAESWKKQNGVDQISKTQRELQALTKELDDNPHNPLLQALAVEKAVSAARGGAASKQALSLALEHMGGSFDNSGAMIAKIKSGEIGPKQMENFRGFIRGQLGTAQAEGKNAYDNFNKYVESQPPQVRDRLLAERGRIFSGLHGFGGQTEGGGHGSAPSGKRVRLKDGRTGTLSADGLFRPDGT